MKRYLKWRVSLHCTLPYIALLSWMWYSSIWTLSMLFLSFSRVFLCTWNTDWSWTDVKFYLFLCSIAFVICTTCSTVMMISWWKILVDDDEWNSQPMPMPMMPDCPKQYCPQPEMMSYGGGSMESYGGGGGGGYGGGGGGGGYGGSMEMGGGGGGGYRRRR